MSRWHSPGVVPAAALVAAAASAAAAYLLIGQLSGVLYAAGIFLLGVFVAARRRSGVRRPQTEKAAAGLRWRRKSALIAELQAELAAAAVEAGELRRVIDELGLRLEREMTEARLAQTRLEARAHELEAARTQALRLLAEERGRVADSLVRLTGDVGRHGGELEALEQELDQLVAGVRS